MLVASHVLWPALRVTCRPLCCSYSSSSYYTTSSAVSDSSGLGEPDDGHAETKSGLLKLRAVAMAKRMAAKAKARRTGAATGFGSLMLKLTGSKLNLGVALDNDGAAGDAMGSTPDGGNDATGGEGEEKGQEGNAGSGSKVSMPFGGLAAVARKQLASKNMSVGTPDGNAAGPDDQHPSALEDGSGSEAGAATDAPATPSSLAGSARLLTSASKFARKLRGAVVSVRSCSLNYTSTCERTLTAGGVSSGKLCEAASSAEDDGACCRGWQRGADQAWVARNRPVYKVADGRQSCCRQFSSFNVQSRQGVHGRWRQAGEESYQVGGCAGMVLGNPPGWRQPVTCLTLRAHRNSATARQSRR